MKFHEKEKSSCRALGGPFRGDFRLRTSIPVKKEKRAIGSGDKKTTRELGRKLHQKILYSLEIKGEKML